MTKHVVYHPPGSTVSDDFDAGIDATPSPTAMQRLAQGFNYISVVQKKQILFRAQNHRSLAGGGNDIVWPIYFRTGEGTLGIVVRCGVTRKAGGAATPPFLNYDVKLPPNTAVVSKSLYFDGGTGSGVAVPEQIARKAIYLQGLSPNTEYIGEAKCTDGLTLAWMSVTEYREQHADDDLAGVCSPAKFANEADILDEHLEDLIEANNLLWRHNGSHLLMWTCDYADRASSPWVSSTSYVNILDATKDPAVRLVTDYHSTRRRTGSAGVPVKMAVRARRVAGTGTADFRLTNGTQNIDIAGAAIATGEAWFTATANIPDSAADWKMQSKVSVGTTTVEISAWSLFEYEA